MKPHESYTIQGPLHPDTLEPIEPRFGEVIAFRTDAPENLYPSVHFSAYIGDKVVAVADTYLYAQADTMAFHSITLGPTYEWIDGPADGKATLFISNNRKRVVAGEIEFPISG